MVKTTIRKKNKPTLKHKTKRNLPYTIRQMKGGGVDISVLSFNVLARNATWHNNSSRDITLLDSDIHESETIEVGTFKPSTEETTQYSHNKKTEKKPTDQVTLSEIYFRPLQADAKPYEHIYDTINRHEKIKTIIINNQCQVVFLQEIDSYLFTYLNNDTNFSNVYEGYYRFPPIAKASSDLFGEFGTAIFWNKTDFTANIKVPLDYVSYGIFKHMISNIDNDTFNIQKLNYPSAIGIHTGQTLSFNMNSDPVIGHINTAIQFDVETARFKNTKMNYASSASSDEKTHANNSRKFSEWSNFPNELLSDKVKGLLYMKQDFTDTKGKIDDLFQKKPATFVRLTHKNNTIIDLVCVHLHGEKQNNRFNIEDNKPRQKMVRFIQDFLNEAQKDKTIALTIIGGDFNLPHNLHETPDTIFTGFSRVEQTNEPIQPTTMLFDYADETVSALANRINENGTPNKEPQWIDHIYYKYGTSESNKHTLYVLVDLDTGKPAITKSVKQTTVDLLASDHYPVKAVFTIK
jgi:hypothetical protein